MDNRGIIAICVLIILLVLGTTGAYMVFDHILVTYGQPENISY